MSYKKTLQRLFSHINREKRGFSLKELKLKNGYLFLEKFSPIYPPIIHIAGTNGKGSTCELIKDALISQGFKCGIFTSPHLLDIRERIRINNILIPKKVFAEYIEKILEFETKYSLNLSFFEILFFVAILYFTESKVDFCIIETGIGGRLDITNIITPSIVGITSIDKDHESILGNTIKDITLEKAGIIKKDKPVVVGKNSNYVKSIIREICKTKNSSFYCEGIDYKVDFLDESVNIKNVGSFCFKKRRLKGDFQLENIGLALFLVYILHKELIKKKIVWNRVVSFLNKTQLPGRFEKVRFGKRYIILDVAHNPEGIKVLLETCKKENITSPYIMFGCMKDKHIRKMISLLEHYSDDILLIDIPMERAYSFKNFGKHLYFREIDKAFEYWKSSSSKDLVICGSFYLLEHMYKILKESTF